MIDFLSPVSKAVIAHKEVLPQGVLGKEIAVHARKGQLPSLANVKFAIFWSFRKSKRCKLSR